jgi:hypothetical protein
MMSREGYERMTGVQFLAVAMESGADPIYLKDARTQIDYSMMKSQFHILQRCRMYGALLPCPLHLYGVVNGHGGNFVFALMCPEWLWAHPDSYPMAIRDSFPGGKVAGA